MRFKSRSEKLIIMILLILLLSVSAFTGCGSGGPAGNGGSGGNGPAAGSPDGSSQDSSGEEFPVMYASRDVNLRRGAGVENPVITLIPRSEPVSVYSTDNGWSKVTFQGQEGYVNAAYFLEKKPLSYERLAWYILETMTEEEQVGQLFFVRCRKDTAIADLKAYSPAGYLLFAPDIRDHTKETLQATLQGYQRASKVGLLLGVDEEGGNVVRVSKYPQFREKPFPSPQSLYGEGGADGFQRIADDTREKAKFLKSLGFNLNLAPVCDISTDPADYIYKRTFGKDAEETAEYVKTVVSVMNSQGIGCTLKHFPGYGGNVDTHLGMAVDSRGYDSFVNSDFIPFQAGIQAGAGSVLVSHNIITAMDGSLPASLSPAVHRVLREDLDFDGVIMTDDLNMGAIREAIGDEVSAVLAINAGNDLIISSDFDVQIPSVLAALENGTITEERIRESALRVLRWKLRLGIIPS